MEVVGTDRLQLFGNRCREVECRGLRAIPGLRTNSPKQNREYLHTQTETTRKRKYLKLSCQEPDSNKRLRMYPIANYINPAPSSPGLGD